MESTSRKPTRKNTTIIRIFSKPVGIALGAEEMQEDALDAVGLEGPHDPAGEENHGHGEGHVQVGVAAPQQRAW